MKNRELSGNSHKPDRTEVRLVETRDGSHTLYSGHFREHYHSVYGAVQESMHVFIDAGLRKIVQSLKEINLLEIGFGTGLNVLLSCQEAFQQNLCINYTSIEAYPLPESVWSTLNYDQVFTHNESSDLYCRICSAAWDTRAEILTGFNLTKSCCRLLEADLSPGHFHLVYFDAFSPEVQPEMWTGDVFKKVFDSMASGGILVTYSCKGVVKQALRSAGFQIEKLPGPPGKREIIRALKLS